MTKDEIVGAIISRLGRELRLCRNLLQGYGDNHICKTPPQVEKAKTNYDRAAEINGAFAHVAELECLLAQCNEVDALREVADLLAPIPANPTETFVDSLDALNGLRGSLSGRDRQDTVLIRMSISTLRSITDRLS